MELTFERWQKKTLRHSFSRIGWILLIYYCIMNLSAFVVELTAVAAGMVEMILSGSFRGMDGLPDQVGESAWGYFLAAGIGLVILLAWKKKRFWVDEIWAKGKPMTASRFFGILSVFLSGQLIYQIFVMAVELGLNGFGLSWMDGLISMAVDSSDFGMFLYAGILAPITEEILFRGLIQRTLLPYGKRFAVICTAFVFGIFHGNLAQAPYAFLVGLVLGYTAAEYSIGWAMVLHTINNLVVADLLDRLTWGMSDVGAALVFWGVILVFSAAAVVVLIRKRRQIRTYGGKVNRLYIKCFFSSPGMIALMAVMGLSMILAAFWMIAPL